MKKIILLLLILTTTFGTINVYADSCTMTVHNDYQYGSETRSINLGRNVIDKWNTNNTILDIGNFNYIKGQIWYAIEDGTGQIISNINLAETCNHTSDGATNYTVTYADGSHSYIQATQWQAICDNHTISGTSSGTYTYEPNIVNVGLAYWANNNKWYQCEVDSNLNFKCPIYNEKTFLGYRFYFTLEKYNSSNIRYGLMTNLITKCTTDTQQIINNQNQNTQNTINTITDSNINSSVITDTNGITNSADSQSQNVVLNFLMIPFNFMTNIVNSFENQCQQVCLGNCGSGHDNEWRFVLPCINLQNLLGNTLYGVIDALMCVTMIFAFIRSVIKFIQKCLLLEVDVGSEVRMFT